MTSKMHRRTFLRQAGFTTAAFAAVAAGAPRPRARADESLAPFHWGVASGDPTARSVLLWTRVDPTLGPRVALLWEVARDVAMTDIVRRATAVADEARDHTAMVDASGLEPGTWYFYRFTAPDGRQSLVGRTKTAPTAGADRLRFAVVSCSNYQGGFFNAYARIAERDDLDAVIHLGDYLYEYGNGAGAYGPGNGTLSAPRPHQPDTEMVALADYRTRHAWYRLDPDLRRLHQLFPIMATWDDHESTDNSWRDGANNHNPDAPDAPAEAGLAWADRKNSAKQAYFEWLPVRASAPGRVWRSLQYGSLAEIILLDTRLERDEQVGTTGATVLSSEIDDPERVMLSPEQRAFLHGRLAESAATWKVVAQQVILAQWNAGGLPDLSPLAGQPDFPQFIRREGNALNPDQWDGYTAERSRLFQTLQDESVSGVVVLTGDVHTSWANDLTPDPYTPTTYNPVTGDGALGVEFVTPSVTSANFEGLGPAAVLAAETATRAANPHVKWVDLDDHGYLILDLSADGAQADWYFVDTVLRPSDVERLGASWRVAAQASHLTPAPAPATAGRAAPATPSAHPRALAAAGATRGAATSSST